MCLAQGPQRGDAGEARTRDPSVPSQALYHWATALPYSFEVSWWNSKWSDSSSVRWPGVKHFIYNTHIKMKHIFQPCISLNTARTETKQKFESYTISNLISTLCIYKFFKVLYAFLKTVQIQISLVHTFCLHQQHQVTNNTIWYLFVITHNCMKIYV